MNKWVPAFFNAGKVTDSLWRRCGESGPVARERERDGHSVHVYIYMIEYFTLLLLNTGIFKVYCADHTYTTLRVPMSTSAAQIVMAVSEKMCLGEDLVLCELKSTGGK